MKKFYSIVLFLMLTAGNIASAFDFSSFNYTWTDSNGTEHTNNVADKATDARQMLALRNYVMSNADIPGNLYVDGIADNGSYQNYSDVNYSVYPKADGFTCFLVELKDGNNLSIPPITGTESNILAAFEQSIKSMQLLTSVTGCGDAYIVSFSGRYDKFYFAAKGKARSGEQDSWERLSATGNNQSVEGTPGFYNDLMEGIVYKVSHDCNDVASLRHFYSINPGTGNEPYLDNVTMVIPKNRMEYWNSSTEDYKPWPNSTGTYRDNAGVFTWYNPKKCPTIGIYQAKLHGTAAPASNYSDENRQFSINLAWDSNLRQTKTEGAEALNADALGWSGNEVYDIFIVNDDGTETLLTSVTNLKDYQYDVQQRQDGYQLRYKVECRPAESEAANPVGPAVSNYVTLAIPGFVDEFIWTYAYRSRFDVASLKNSYKNTVRLSPYKYDRTIAPERVLWRKKADGSDVTKIATLNIASDGTYTITYNNPLATEAALRFDTEPLTTSGTIDGEITINDYFLASTAAGGDTAGAYYYYIEVIKADGKTHTESVEIPVYGTDINTIYPYEYTIADMNGDTDRSLVPNDVAKVKMTVPDEQKYNAVSSWNIYKGTTLQYVGSTEANADIINNNIAYYTGQLNVNSGFGTNTYGTNQSPAQGAYVSIGAQGRYSYYASDTSGKYDYAADLTITPSTATLTAPYVLYYRVWRSDDGTEVLLNDLDGNKAGWKPDYSSMKTLYPIGESTGEDTKVADAFVADAFSKGGTKAVTYIVRMYTTPTAPAPASASNLYAVSGDPEQKVYVSEASVTLTYAESLLTGVTHIESESQVVSTTYYDMLGNASSAPRRGLNIKVDRHADGTLTTSKIVK